MIYKKTKHIFLISSQNVYHIPIQLTKVFTDSTVASIFGGGKKGTFFLALQGCKNKNTSTVSIYRKFYKFKMKIL